MSRFDRPLKSYSRGRGRSEAPKAILIVTEGEKTEVLYFKALREALRLTKELVKVTSGKGTDPENLIKEAIRLKRERRREAAQSTDTPAFEEVWCVLDSEGTTRVENLEKAMAAAEREDIRLALSRPCFEFWLLLHFEYTTRFFPNCKAAGQDLEKHLPHYEKNSLPWDRLFPQLAQAVENTQRIRRHHQTAGSHEPATDVDLLVRKLNACTRAQYQLPLPPCP
jgi:hypothetical protein